MAQALSDQTLAHAYQKARKMLRDAFGEQSLATPDLDARLLVAAACGVEDHAPLLDGGRELSRIEWDIIDGYIARRLKGEPVARILGEKAFWSHRFIVNENTLVPRPETEGIVEEVLKWAINKGRQGDALRIVDIGTGSGAILISLLRELPEAIGFAVDVSKPALDVAIENAARHKVGGRFFPVLSSYGAGLDGLFDVVVSNPPYIAGHERDDLAVDVSDYDPNLALFAVNDGLAAFEEIIPWCRKHLVDDGFCMIEHGAKQSDAVLQIASDNGFKRCECVFDMANLPRFVKIVEN